MESKTLLNIKPEESSKVYRPVKTQLVPLLAHFPGFCLLTKSSPRIHGFLLIPFPFSQSLYFQNMNWTVWQPPYRYSSVCAATDWSDFGICTVSLLQWSQQHIQATSDSSMEAPCGEQSFPASGVMGILPRLHSANSQLLLEWRARGPGKGTEGQSSAACCIPLLLNVCLPPRPLSALQPLAFWHWNFTHRGKNQKLLHVFSSKERKIQEDAWREINWTGCSNNWISMRILHAPNGSALLPPTASCQQLPGVCCGHSLTTLGSGATSRQKSWGGVQFVVQLLSSTCAVSQILVMPVLHLNGAICTTFGFKPVQPLLERFRFTISFAP